MDCKGQVGLWELFSNTWGASNNLKEMEEGSICQQNPNWKQMHNMKQG